MRRVYEVDPLVCAKRGGEMRIISVILDPAVIKRILHHGKQKREESESRGPPTAAQPLAAAS